MRRARVVPVALAACLLAAGTASAADRLPAKAAAAADRPNTVLIKAEPGVAGTVASRYGLKVLRSFPQIGWSEVTLGDDPDTTLDKLNADTDVKGLDIGRDDEEFKPQYQPRDTIWNQGATIPFGTGQVAMNWNYTIANFPAAWDITRGSSSVVVGVIDSEFDIEHTELKQKLRPGWNVNSGTVGYRTADVRATSCDEIHGTHVAGTVAGDTDNNLGISGAGFDVTILPVRASFNFQTGAGATDAKFVADVTEGLLWIADRGVVAVNMSFGTTRPHQALQDAINYAASKGVTLVAAAGNDQQRQPGAAHYPASYSNVIAVAATKPGDVVSDFSSNGNYVDVAAPGEPVFSTWDNRCQNAMFNQGNDLYHSISGTSMAAPLVSGLVGLMKSVRSDLTPAEIESILKSTARDLGPAGQDHIFGAGRIDAAAAVTKARDFQRPVPAAPPPPPPPPPAPQVVKVVNISGTPKYNRKTRTLSVKVSCPRTFAFCAGEVTVKGGKQTLGKRAFSLDRGKSTTLRLKFSAAKLKKAAKKKSKVKLSIAAVARDTAGVKRTTTKSVTIKR